MTHDLSADTSRLCLHTITTKPWPVETAVKKYAAAGVSGVTVWRNALEGRNPAEVGELIRGQGLEIVSLCRGGFFPHPEQKRRDLAIRENLTVIDEAAALGAPLVVLVVGAHPGQSLDTSRRQIAEGIRTIHDHAATKQVRLAVEPLHPMYADDRSAINTMAQANDLCESLDSPWIGVAVDVYHIWWDPDLQAEIARCGAHGNLFAFHGCDWKTPTTDLLHDRGLMGEGCINIRKIRGWVVETGFSGYNEVEIFSNDYWETNQDTFLENIIKAYKKHT